jgi:hypothetical protein
MYTDDYLSREIRDILSRKPDATHKEIVQALTYRARLKWGRIPPAVQLWQRGLDSAEDITRKYRPDQPRVPEGSSEGGEWTRDPNSSEGGREAREAARPKARAANTSEGGREARRNATYDYLRDKNGNLLRNINGDVIPYPRAFPPEFFMSRAEAALPKDNTDAEVLKSTDRILADVLKFRHGQMWDMQRQFTEGSNRPDFNENLRDYSTVAIGIYSAGIKIPKEISLGGQAIYAALFSVMPKGEEKWQMMELIGTNFPMRNKHNTALGYKLARELRR